MELFSFIMDFEHMFTSSMIHTFWQQLEIHVEIESNARILTFCAYVVAGVAKFFLMDLAGSMNFSEDGYFFVFWFLFFFNVTVSKSLAVQAGI